MVIFQFEVVGSRRGGAVESRVRGSSVEFTPSTRRRPHSDTLVNDAADGLKRTGINGSQRIFDQDYIPEWLILNILIRLPSKFVVTCMLVCKQWASLISDPSFVRSYISHTSSSSPSSWTAIQEKVQLIDPQTIRLLEHRSRRNFGDLCLPTAHECNKFRTFEVFGASNGLILFGLKYDYSVTCSIFYVCNPVTRKMISLSPPPQEYLGLAWRAGSGFVARISDAAVLESFRVVLLVRAERLLFVVYASETREWSGFPFPGDKSSSEDVLKKNPAALDGVLHWETRDGSIIAYDPYGEPSRSIRVVAPPEDLDARGEADDTELRCRCMIDGSTGKLRYLERSVVEAGEDRSALRLRTWVREDDGRGWRASGESDDTSVLLRVHRLPDLVLSSLSPMFFDPSDSGVVYLVILGFLLSYDFGSREFSVVESVPNRWAFVLELSPWPISIRP